MAEIEGPYGKPTSSSPGYSALDFQASKSIDRPLMLDAIKQLLTAIGVDPDSEVMRETPRRVTEGLTELITSPPFRISVFPNSQSYDELVVIKDIPFSSLCEHHLLPFSGVIHMGYLPRHALVGLSKLARAAQYLSKGLQIQEGLTVQLAEWMVTMLDPLGAGVVVKATHLCMTLRGAKAVGSVTTTSALRGSLRDDARARAEFFAFVNSQK